MKQKIFTSFCAAFLLLLAIVESAFAVRTPGVSVNDWAFYDDIRVYWNSSYPVAPPSNLLKYNETEWMNFTVQNIVGTNVTLESTVQFKNGTQKNSIEWINIQTGEGTMNMSLVGANLNVSDPIYESPDYLTWTINETVDRFYPDGMRQTNHLNITVEEVDEKMGYYFYESLNFYWDKSTGILVEMNHTMHTYVLNDGLFTKWSLFFQITESNLWVVPEFPTLPLLLTMFVAVSFATAVVKRKMC